MLNFQRDTNALKLISQKKNNNNKKIEVKGHFDDKCTKKIVLPARTRV